MTVFTSVWTTRSKFLTLALRQFNTETCKLQATRSLIFDDLSRGFRVFMISGTWCPRSRLHGGWADMNREKSHCGSRSEHQPTSWTIGSVSLTIMPMNIPDIFSPPTTNNLLDTNSSYFCLSFARPTLSLTPLFHHSATPPLSEPRLSDLA